MSIQNSNGNSCDFATMDVNYISVAIREIKDVKEKRKWTEYFRKDYSGEVNPINQYMFGDMCRYFVARADGKDVGFIRITNQTENFKKYFEGDVWNAASAYVKKPYRGQSILRQMIEYVMENCQVSSLRIENERYEKNRVYYKTLGFSYAWTVGNGKLVIAVTEELKEAAIRRNKDMK